MKNEIHVHMAIFTQGMSAAVSVDNSVTRIEYDLLPEAVDNNQSGDGVTGDLSDSSTGADNGQSTT